MNKKLLALSLAAILAAPSAFAATGSDNQTVTVTVPEVALLNIVDATEDLSLAIPGAAGDNFTPTTATTDYKISANTESGGTKKRKIDVSVTGTIPTGGTLTITPLATGITGATPAAKTLTGANPTASDLITGIGNVANTVTDGITYSFGPTSPTEMIGYTASPTTITVTYTLSVDS
ncbi:hypothetical protein [Candidatus Thiothrix anitrata]|uniref:WxL domain-containing protein n=1 Tax=Candidatus Thiothrix anitrata TaxID=2823902 RepID=A0ABX7WZF8_9GAMM|nr:hypothetical protein [Candidatus Thiothrix anitrata]QTR49010.1 hypothetical protein J8380_12080 [Candidatus Thiothrix anitrata]